MKLKPGVRIHGIQPEMVLGLSILRALWPAEMVVTSVVDGKHSRGSLHYTGCAVDLRTRNLDPAEIQKVAVKARERLGDDFDVVVEKTHMHVEYQPKAPLGS